MRRVSILAAALLCVSLTPAYAGSIYIPIFNGLDIDGNVYDTDVRISNLSEKTRRYGTHFIPAGTVGTSPPRGAPSAQVNPGSSIVLPVISGAGLLEIDGAPQNVVSATLRVENGTGDFIDSAAMPVLSSDNLLQAGEVAHLQGLMRTPAGTVTNFALVNLAKTTTSCTVAFYDLFGEAIEQTAVIAINALTYVQFDEVFDLLGRSEVANARAAVTCDQPFYTFATLLQNDPVELTVVRPALSLNSDLIAPGRTPPVPPGTVFFQVDGIFLNAVAGNSRVEYKLPVEPGVTYKRIEIDFDFRFGGFRTNLFHTITTLRSGGPYLALMVRGSNKKTILETANNGRGDGSGLNWRQGRIYHFEIVLDTGTNQVTVSIFDGAVLAQQVTAPANRFDLGNIDGSLRLDFSQDRVLDNAFFPLIGSQFSDLEVVIKRN